MTYQEFKDQTKQTCKQLMNSQDLSDEEKGSIAKLIAFIDIKM